VNQGLNRGDSFQMAINQWNEKSNRSSLKTIKAKEPVEIPDEVDFGKVKVECICPKCGTKHMMNFRWIGRGTPRKFCPLCKFSDD
jgi:hypothetical protein